MDCFENYNRYGTYDEAMESAGNMFDSGVAYNFRIVDEAADLVYNIAGHTLTERSCPVCGRVVRQYQMERTHDCHGIPFRLVCGSCYDRILEYPGFDGEEYSGADECLDYDY